MFFISLIRYFDTLLLEMADGPQGRGRGRGIGGQGRGVQHPPAPPIIPHAQVFIDLLGRLEFNHAMVDHLNTEGVTTLEHLNLITKDTMEHEFRRMDTLNLPCSIYTCQDFIISANAWLKKTELLYLITLQLKL